MMIKMIMIINDDDFNGNIGGLTDLGRLCRCCQLEKGCPAEEQMIKRIDVQYKDKSQINYNKEETKENAP